jgi:hypothetical protein
MYTCLHAYVGAPICGSLANADTLFGAHLGATIRHAWCRTGEWGQRERGGEQFVEWGGNFLIIIRKTSIPDVKLERQGFRAKKTGKTGEWGGHCFGIDVQLVHQKERLPS